MTNPGNVAPEQPSAPELEPRLLALLFCDWANQTEDGKTNLMGIFDRVLVPELPHRSPPFFLYARFLSIQGGRIEIVITSPGGDEAGRLSASWEGPELAGIEGEPIFSQVITRAAFEPKQAGPHWFEVLHDGRPIGRAPLLVNLRAGEEDAAGARPAATD